MRKKTIKPAVVRLTSSEGDIVVQGTPDKDLWVNWESSKYRYSVAVSCEEMGQLIPHRGNEAERERTRTLLSLKDITVEGAIHYSAQGTTLSLGLKADGAEKEWLHFDEENMSRLVTAIKPYLKAIGAIVEPPTAPLPSPIFGLV